jgi:hypothetical protein
VVAEEEDAEESNMKRAIEDLVLLIERLKGRVICPICLERVSKRSISNHIQKCHTFAYNNSNFKISIPVTHVSIEALILRTVSWDDDMRIDMAKVLRRWEVTVFRSEPLYCDFVPPNMMKIWINLHDVCFTQVSKLTSFLCLLIIFVIPTV